MSYSSTVSFVSGSVFDPYEGTVLPDRYQVELIKDDVTVETFSIDASEADAANCILGPIVAFISTSGMSDTSVNADNYEYPADFVSSYITNTTELDLDTAYQGWLN